MALILRTLTSGKIAFAVWRMPDGSYRTVKVTQSDYDNFALTRRGVGDIAGKPDPAAVFIMAAGGIPALNTADGFPSPSDCWVQTIRGVQTLVVCNGSGFDWSYSSAVSTDPVGAVSQLQGVKLVSTGNRIRITNYNTVSPTLTSVPTVTTSLTITPINETISNHHSVTFDATSSSSTDGEVGSLTFAHTMSAAANGYIAVGSYVANNLTVSSVTFDSVGMGAQLSGKMDDRTGEYWDLVAPHSGTHNVVVTYSDSVQGYPVAGALSATGVDQTTPRSHTATDQNSTNNPSLTITSAAGELVFTFLGYFGGTDTVDASWTNDFQNSNTSIINLMAGAHKSGAAPSVTRTDSLIGVNDWTFLGASLGVAPTGPTLIQQPGSQVVRVGDKATFTTSATTSGGTLHYDWEVDTGGGFANATGATDSPSYTTPTLVLGDDGAVYRCNVSDDNGTTTTNSATLHVRPVTYGTLGNFDPDLLIKAWF